MGDEQGEIRGRDRGIGSGTALGIAPGVMVGMIPGSRQINVVQQPWQPIDDRNKQQPREVHALCAPLISRYWPHFRRWLLFDPGDPPCHPILLKPLAS